MSLLKIPPLKNPAYATVVSNNEKLAQNMDSEFEPRGTLEEEEGVLVDDILDASASTFDAGIDDISESDNDLFNTKPACKRRKQHQRKTSEKGGYN